jgi:hypothetical protein
MDEQWGRVTFELDRATFNANDHPPEIAAAVDICHEHRSSGLRIVTHSRMDDPDKVFRDYFLSPETLRLCGPLFLHVEMEFCPPPADVLGSYPIT